jgi:hypothetical protein
VFENCDTLAELNQERKRLLSTGVQQVEVNSAYNKAKAALIEKAPSYRHIPTYTGVAEEAKMFLALPVLSEKGRKNEIIITPRGVLL